MWTAEYVGEDERNVCSIRQLKADFLTVQTADCFLYVSNNNRGNVRINVTLRRVRVTIFAYVALVIQHVKRKHHVILSSVACPAIPYFSTLSHKETIFGKNIYYRTSNVCFDFLYVFYLKRFLFLEEMSKILS
jgi:hypothetical protein